MENRPAANTLPAGLCLIRCAYAPKLTLLAASTKLGS